MDLEQENKELQRYIRELKQEIKDLHDQLSFLKSKDQQIIMPPGGAPEQNNFIYWHTALGKDRTIQDDIYDTYYRSPGEENGY